MCELSVYYQLFKDYDENGSSTWCKSNYKFSIFYYYNDDEIDFKRKLNRLNLIVNKFEI